MNIKTNINAVGQLPGLSRLYDNEAFSRRHIGPDETEINAMLQAIQHTSLENLISETVPASIAFKGKLELGEALTEEDALALLRTMVASDNPGRSYIGMGYYDTYTPAVILRNVLENPGWYTAYTPYQPEISQGRLECLLNFQQMILDLTAMEMANASLLDEATAAAEGMALAHRVSKNTQSNSFFVDHNCYPQTIDVLQTRAKGSGYELIIDSPDKLAEYDVFGAIFQYPAMSGKLSDFTDLISDLHEIKAIAIVVTDLMSLALLKPPGEMGADVVVGSSQRFGVPLGYGGPHAAFFATRDCFKRSIPGRMIGVSIDARGKQALRMALQTREQHIRREKANSNICTAQVLLANVAALYAMYHGPEGLANIASRIHRLTHILYLALQQSGISIKPKSFFDTLTITCSAQECTAILLRAEKAQINLRYLPHTPEEIGVSLDECCSEKDLDVLWQVLSGDESSTLDIAALDSLISTHQVEPAIPKTLKRFSACLQHPVFGQYHSETDMMRYLKALENKDISLTHSMIPLGSCTMKLNASAEMMPISWPEFNHVHPFTPIAKVPGYQAMIQDLEDMLAEIMGFDGVSMQPNSGAQGEYAGLLTIRKFLDDKGDSHRNVCLIPSSAHGTNPASAQMVGMKVVIVACDDKGNVDIADLVSKAGEYSDSLAALMITYPSTHGVFEESIKEICSTIHEHGGQVYMDGANLNAQVGISRPGEFGADVSHVNLHKTFCIPHGGGGPGMGPIGVKSHLLPYLPSHSVITIDQLPADNTAVSAAPWGSASILPISWMYMKMMGATGLAHATRVAILNANYIAHCLGKHYPVLYTGKNNTVAHECIIDLRPFKSATGITDVDVAKRLMDFGFHAPTMSFPVAGTLMIEPTESESKPELDRFIEAMIIIRQEIAEIENGNIDPHDNPLVNAPHTLADITEENWVRSYSRERACFPASWLRSNKYWPVVNRVDNVYGDRNLICSCPTPEDYQ